MVRSFRGFQAFAAGCGTAICRRDRLALAAEARQEGLPYVEITTGVGNVASQKVITANGGVLVEQFTADEKLGREETLRYRIQL